MKKYIISILVLFVATLSAFDSVIPAKEMSGNYLKLQTCYQKIFGDFENGFNRFGFSIAKPKVYKNFSLSTDMEMFGDGIFHTFEMNISPGITFNKRFTFSISTGFTQRSLATGDLIFGQDEVINGNSITKMLLGTSFFAKFYQDKLGFSFAAFHLNKPDISFDESGDKLPMKIQTALNWQINRIYNIGIFYKLEDEQNYLGLNFSLLLPAPYLEHEFRVNQERISYRPSIHTFNYFSLKMNYDYYFDSDNLGYKNYGICIGYEYPTERKPVIDWINIPKETDLQQQQLIFEIKEPERIKFVRTYLDSTLISNRENIWDYENKRFEVTLPLKEGENKIEVEVKGINGPVYYYDFNAYYFTEELVEEPLPDTTIVDTSNVIIPQEITEKDTTDTTEPAAVIIAVEQDSIDTGSDFYYLVEKGDNLWNIAKREEIYDDPFKWKVIYQNNNDIISNPDLIYPGQKFLIIKEKEDDNIKYYKVEKGDCLWNIARKDDIFGDGRKWKVIYFVNKDKIKDPNMIYPGQKLKIIFRNK